MQLGGHPTDVVATFAMNTTLVSSWTESILMTNWGGRLLKEIRLARSLDELVYFAASYGANSIRSQMSGLRVMFERERESRLHFSIPKSFRPFFNLRMVCSRDVEMEGLLSTCH